MESLQASRINGGNTDYKRNESDFYTTPPDVTLALMQALALPKRTCIWEPACGENHIVNELKREGYGNIIATDIKTGTDFLDKENEMYGIKNFNIWIITNPPFSIADKFIVRCLEIEKPFALLLKSQYWNSKKRFNLFKYNPPSTIYPLAWKPDFLFGTRGSGSLFVDMMWCVWDRYETKYKDTRYIPLERPKIDK